MTSDEGTSSFLGRIIIVNEENGGFQTSLKEEPKDEYYLSKTAGRHFILIIPSLTLTQVHFSLDSSSFSVLYFISWK